MARRNAARNENLGLDSGNLTDLTAEVNREKQEFLPEVLFVQLAVAVPTLDSARVGSECCTL